MSSTRIIRCGVEVETSDETIVGTNLYIVDSNNIEIHK